ncbi:MAG: serine/threonine protein kinase [Planctomycetota bacterium]|nr:MAG: serine/threonine protein kinase [Planctomycetota bacterium]
MKYAFKPGDRPLEGYTIKRAIGRGGFGEVYYAVSDAGKEVALKLLQEDVDVELRGIRQCLNLQHPALVTIFDVRQDRDADYWIVMEYVAGPTLADFIAEHPSGVTLPEVVDWLRPVAEGLQYLHERGIVHRDVKPANVYRSGRVVKLGDVGLAKFIAPSRRSAHTHSVGTVHYMAPEVARGSYGPEVDVYAVATIAYEMLTGRVPFDGETPAEILMRHLTDTPDWTAVPDAVRPVLAAALEKDPRRRTGSVRRFIDELAACRGGCPAVAGATATACAGVARAADAPADPPGPVITAGVAVSGDGRPAGDRSPVAIARERMQSPRRVNGHDGGGHSRDPADTQPHGARWGAVAAADSPGEQAVPIGVRVAEVRAGGDRRPELRRRGDGHAEPRAGGRTGWFWPTVASMLLLAALLGRRVLAGVLEYALPALIAAAAILAVYQLLVFMIRSLVGCVRGPAGVRNDVCQEREAARDRPHGAFGGDFGRGARAGSVFASPNVARRIPWRARIVRFAAACPVALVCVASITAAVNELAYPLGDWPHVAYFGVTACVGAWLLLLLGKFWEGIVHERELRRLSYACAGAVLGFIAWWLEELLQLELRSDFGLFSQVGRHPLVDRWGRPTWMGFVVFFALLFGLRRWWWHTDELRPKRFRVASVALTSLLAVLLAELFTFPVVWALLWAATVSSAVQVASSWALVDFQTFLREVQRRRRSRSVHTREVRP